MKLIVIGGVNRSENNVGSIGQEAVAVGICPHSNFVDVHHVDEPGKAGPGMAFKAVENVS